MNWLDFTALVLMFGGAVLGWFSGLLRWAFMLVGAVAGAVLAGEFYVDASSVFRAVTDNEAFQQAAAFGSIFAGVFLAALLVSVLVKKALNLVWMGWIDSLTGMVAGFLAGALCAAALTWTLGVVPSESARDAVRESALADAMLSATAFLREWLPPEFRAIERALEAGEAMSSLTPGPQPG